MGVKDVKRYESMSNTAQVEDRKRMQRRAKMYKALSNEDRTALVELENIVRNAEKIDRLIKEIQ